MPWITVNGAHVLIGEDGEPVDPKWVGRIGNSNPEDRREELLVKSKQKGFEWNENIRGMVKEQKHEGGFFDSARIRYDKSKNSYVVGTLSKFPTELGGNSIGNSEFGRFQTVDAAIRHSDVWLSERKKQMKKG